MLTEYYLREMPEYKPYIRFTAIIHKTRSFMMSIRNILYGLPVLSCIFIMSCNRLENNTIVTADPQASIQTQHLLSGMKQLVEKGVLIGHQDDLAYGIGWIAPNGQSDIYRICSDYPAVFGWDLGHMETGSAVNLDSVPFADMKTYARQVHSLGAINTFSWHCDNPLTGGSAWDTQTPGVVASILPGGEQHAAYLRWLDHGDAVPDQYVRRTHLPAAVVYVR